MTENIWKFSNNKGWEISQSYKPDNKSGEERMQKYQEFERKWPFGYAQLWGCANLLLENRKKKKRQKKIVNLSLFRSSNIWWQRMYSVSSSSAPFPSDWIQVTLMCKQREPESGYVVVYRQEWLEYCTTDVLDCCHHSKKWRTIKWKWLEASFSAILIYIYDIIMITLHPRWNWQMKRKNNNLFKH